ncbi:Translation initiation factor eIF-2B subunit gamma, partial [Marasmius crinis-equi]
FVVLPCDFIPPPLLPLSSILNKFRTESFTDGAMATTCRPQALKPTKTPPIVWDESTGTLLHLDNLDDLVRNSEEIDLKMSLLSQYGHTPMYSRFDNNKEVPVIPILLCPSLSHASDSTASFDIGSPWAPGVWRDLGDV